VKLNDRYIPVIDDDILLLYLEIPAERSARKLTYSWKSLLSIVIIPREGVFSR
jgi:hypothetical protein